MLLLKFSHHMPSLGNATAEQEFPYFLTSIPNQIQPSHGVIELHDSTIIPRSLLTTLPHSCAPILEVQQLETLDIGMQLLKNPVTTS